MSNQTWFEIVLNKQRNGLMLAVISMHVLVGWLGAQQSAPELAVGQSSFAMALDFSNVAEASEVFVKEEAIKPLEEPKFEPEPEPEPDPEPEPEPEPEPASQPDPIVAKKPKQSPPEPPPLRKVQSKPIQANSTPKKTLPNRERMSASVQQHGLEQQTETTKTPVRVSVSQLAFDGNPPMPHYPRQARLKGDEGLVVVRIIIDRLGRVEKCFVVRSSGFGLLDAAALEASTALRFKPYRVNAKSKRTVVDMPFNFLLNK